MLVERAGQRSNVHFDQRLDQCSVSGTYDSLDGREMWTTSRSMSHLQ